MGGQFAAWLGIYSLSKAVKVYIGEGGDEGAREKKGEESIRKINLRWTQASRKAAEEKDKRRTNRRDTVTAEVR